MDAGIGARTWNSGLRKQHIRSPLDDGPMEGMRFLSPRAEEGNRWDLQGVNTRISHGLNFMKFQCEITNGDLNPSMFLSDVAGKSKNGGELLAKKDRTRWGSSGQV